MRPHIGKAILLYIITIIIIRVMGKSAFAQLTAHDLAGMFFVVTLAVSSLVAKNITHTITTIIVIGLVHITFSKLTLVNRLNKLFIGNQQL
ncbi:hypothetical protein [Oceanobacillus jordanicus]|uniref:DUF421 domain-containing protein n=1 Tax=Oceanobacillus jordanicus TaxID=2867266 RepID=A0AAW5B7R0_9BACI|nr:hypothetical protein [Oceanobacillus jordanicus]MCG3420058.1 hypothetical protein [Oceanobacillus jordanicus]